MFALAAYLVIYHKFYCNQLPKHHFFYFDLAALHKAPCLGEIASSYLVMIAVIAMTMVIAVMEIKMVITAMITMMTMVMMNITTMKIARPFGRRRF